MFEVLRFIEHGAHCRQSVDFVKGRLLADYLKESEWVDKSKVFRWFRQMAIQAEQYERSRGGTNYRYLNPYGVIVTEDEEILLLNMESEENEFVKRQMQKRAVRAHFVKPMYDLKKIGSTDADLFSFGKTMQFVLAYTETKLDLTKRETVRLTKVIEKCLAENHRKYQDFRQVLKELPIFDEKHKEKMSFLRKRIVIIVGTVLLAVGFLFFLQQVRNKDSGEEKTIEHVQKSIDKDEKKEEFEDVQKLDERMIEKYFNEQANPLQVVEKGKQLQSIILWKMAEAYETMNLHVEENEIYELLLKVESDNKKLEVIREKQTLLKSKIP